LQDSTTVEEVSEEGAPNGKALQVRATWPVVFWESRSLARGKSDCPATETVLRLAAFLDKMDSAGQEE